MDPKKFERAKKRKNPKLTKQEKLDMGMDPNQEVMAVDPGLPQPDQQVIHGAGQGRNQHNNLWKTKQQIVRRTGNVNGIS